MDGLAESTPVGVGLEYNSRLCRAPEPSPRDPGVIRVLLIGDSFTEGQGVRAADTFASLLGRSLGARVEVLNCGRRGLDFPLLHEFFDRQLSLEPDLVVYAMVLNDPVRSPEFNARQAFLDDWIMDRRRMLGSGQPVTPPRWSSWLVALAQDRLEGARVGRETLRWYQEMYAEPNHAGWAATQDHVVAMQRALEARGGRLLVALLPLMLSFEDGGPLARVSRTIAAAFAARGVPFHDTTPAFRGQRPAELWVHPADRHPNERAHRVIADDLRPLVQRLVDDAHRRRR